MSRHLLPVAPSARQSTESRILSLLALHGPLHRAALARALELSRSRVTGVVTHLLEQGVLTEIAIPAASDIDGRAGPALTIPSSRAAVAGVQITTRSLSVHLSSLTGQCLAESRVELPHTFNNAGEMVDAVRDLYNETLAQAPESRVITVGTGFFGRVDRANGEARAHAGNPWSGVNIAELLEAALGVPTVVENNSRLEAMAEAQWGAGQNVNLMVYLHLSAGLTSTVVIDGTPLAGAHGGAGEIGHVSVDPQGPICSCGNRGCLALYASSPEIQRAVGAESFAQAVHAYVNGNAKAQRVFSEAINAVARASAALSTFYEPELIVVGGDFALIGPSLLRQLEDAHNAQLYPGVMPARFELARFGGTGRGGAHAAALLARYQVAQELLLDHVTLVPANAAPNLNHLQEKQHA